MAKINAVEYFFVYKVIYTWFFGFSLYYSWFLIFDRLSCISCGLILYIFSHSSAAVNFACVRCYKWYLHLYSRRWQQLLCLSLTHAINWNLASSHPWWTKEVENRSNRIHGSHYQKFLETKTDEFNDMKSES